MKTENSKAEQFACDIDVLKGNLHELDDYIRSRHPENATTSDFALWLKSYSLALVSWAGMCESVSTFLRNNKDG